MHRRILKGYLCIGKFVGLKLIQYLCYFENVIVENPITHNDCLGNRRKGGYNQCV
jgi:hypothetical protein